MKIPSEEAFDSLFSEISSLVQREHGSDGEGHSDDCEICQMREEFYKRDTTLIDKEKRICLFDEWVGRRVSESPLRIAAMAMPQLGLDLIDIARLSFYFGLKMGYAQKEKELMETSFLEKE